MHDYHLVVHYHHHYHHTIAERNPEPERVQADVVLVDGHEDGEADDVNHPDQGLFHHHAIEQMEANAYQCDETVY